MPHLFLSTEATHHPASPLVGMVFLAVMANITGVGLATAREPEHTYPGKQKKVNGGEQHRGSKALCHVHLKECVVMVVMATLLANMGTGVHALDWE